MTLDQQIEQTKYLIKVEKVKRIKDDYIKRLKILEQFKEEEIKSKRLQEALDYMNYQLDRDFEDNVDIKVYKREMYMRKRMIVEEYGKEPTVCYYYYLHNAIDYAGEETVRASFESIKGQGDEIIVGDCGSTDKTKEIAKEYGFKIIEVEESGVVLPQSKIVNKITIETKCNFLVDLDVHVVYPKNTNDVVVKWINENDIITKMLALRGKWINERCELQVEWGFSSSMVFYRPYLLGIRGYNEKTSLGFGCIHYILFIIQNVLYLEFDNVDLKGMIHKYHIPEKTKTMKDIFKINDLIEEHIKSVSFGKELANELRIDFDKGKKQVVNSYW